MAPGGSRITSSVTKVEVNSVRSRAHGSHHRAPRTPAPRSPRAPLGPSCSPRAGSACPRRGSRSTRWRAGPSEPASALEVAHGLRACGRGGAPRARRARRRPAPRRARHPRTRPRVPRPGVRDDGHSPGRPHQLDRAHRVGRVVRDVVGAVVAEPPRERLVAVARPTPAVTSASAMCGRPAVAPSSTSGAHRLHRHRGMPSAAISATIRSSRVSRLSRARASSATSSASSGSGRYASRWMPLAPPAARHLDAGHQPDAVRARRVARLRPAHVVSWSVSATVVEARLDRPLQRPDGASVPSLAVEWVCRSIATRPSVVAGDTPRAPAPQATFPGIPA